MLCVHFLRLLQRSNDLQSVAVHCWTSSCTIRLHEWRVQEAMELLQGLSPALTAAASQPPASAGEAMLGCLQRAATPGLLGPSSKAFASSVLLDVEQVIAQGRPAMLCALCDLHRLTVAALAQSKLQQVARNGSCQKSPNSYAGHAADVTMVLGQAETDMRRHSRPMQPRAGLQQRGPSSRGSSIGKSAAQRQSMRAQARCAERKVWFCMCYINEQTPAMCALLLQSLQTIKDELLIAAVSTEDSTGTEGAVRGMFDVQPKPHTMCLVQEHANE